MVATPILLKNRKYSPNSKITHKEDRTETLNIEQPHMERINFHPQT